MPGFLEINETIINSEKKRKTRVHQAINQYVYIMERKNKAI